MYQFKELEKMKRDEIRKVAKELKIQKWYDMNKSEMIEAIISEQKNISEVVSVQNDCMNGKEKYLYEIKVGALVAFKVECYGKIKYKTAAVENYNKSKRLLKLKTKYGAEFIVPFENVIWVRTNNRWPKGVYQLLKGIKKDEEKGANQSRA